LFCCPESMRSSGRSLKRCCDSKRRADPTIVGTRVGMK
jgi:hypothetical protein